MYYGLLYYSEKNPSTTQDFNGVLKRVSQFIAYDYLTFAVRTSALTSSSLSHELVRSGKVHIQSHNNFPTAAGLASSAAGYACLGKGTLSSI